MNLHTTLPLPEKGTELLDAMDFMHLALSNLGLRPGHYEEQTATLYSEPIKTYPLDQARLQFLSSCGIKRPTFPSDSADARLNENHLIDESLNYWNFRGHESAWSIQIGIAFSSASEGVSCKPFTTPSISYGSKIAVFGLFRALVNSDPELDSPLAKEVAQSTPNEYGQILLSYDKIGMKGITTLWGLFRDVFQIVSPLDDHQNKFILKILETTNIFEPPPDHIMVTKAAQAKVKRIWLDQLHRYRLTLFAKAFTVQQKLDRLAQAI